MCLICNKIVSANKEYNIKQHYEANHTGSLYEKMHGDDRKQKVNQLQKQLNSQRFMFQNMSSNNEKVLRNNFLIAKRIAKKKTKAWSDGDLVKKCLINVAEEVCQKMVSEIQKFSLSR